MKMVQECNDQAKLGKATEGWPSAQNPLHDREAVRGAFKAAQSCGANEAALLQAHGFPPQAEFLDGAKKFLVGEKPPAPFQNDGKDQARQDVMKGMTDDQKKLVGEQQEAYAKAVEANRQNAIWGTSMTEAKYPSLDDPKYKELKAREDAVNQKTIKRN
jgi:hypothetical protein